jgi:tryptophanase
LDKRIKDLKNKYEQIDIPENVDEVIDKGIMKGRMEMKRERQKRNWVKGLGAVAAAALLLTVTVNMIPAVANSIENIPGVENWYRC